MTNKENNTSNSFSEEIEKDVAKSIKNAVPLSNAARLEVQAAYEEFVKRNKIKRSNKNAFVRLLALFVLLLCFSGCAARVEFDWFGKSEKDYQIVSPNRQLKSDSFDRGK